MVCTVPPTVICVTVSGSLLASVSLLSTLPVTGVSSGVLLTSGLATTGSLVTLIVTVAVSVTPPLVTVYVKLSGPT